jgi:hypothetical protein
MENKINNMIVMFKVLFYFFLTLEKKGFLFNYHQGDKEE